MPRDYLYTIALLVWLLAVLVLAGNVARGGMTAPRADSKNSPVTF